MARILVIEDDEFVRRCCNRPSKEKDLRCLLRQMVK